MRIEPTISSVSIVLVGNLNPKIFSPDWFARHQLLTPKESDAAEVEIIHPQVTKFRTDWLELSVEPNRLSADTSHQPILLRDLILRTFTELLSHTPITMIGINRSVHFSVSSKKTRDNIGFKLAPPSAWGEWSQELLNQGGENHSGLQKLTMRQVLVKGRERGHIQATVEPSKRLPNNVGIYMNVNDHYEVVDPENIHGCSEIMGHLETNFETSLKHSDWIINQVMILDDA